MGQAGGRRQETGRLNQGSSTHPSTRPSLGSPAPGHGTHRANTQNAWPTLPGQCGAQGKKALRLPPGSATYGDVSPHPISVSVLPWCPVPSEPLTGMAAGPAISPGPPAPVAQEEVVWVARQPPSSSLHLPVRSARPQALRIKAPSHGPRPQQGCHVATPTGGQACPENWTPGCEPHLGHGSGPQGGCSGRAAGQAWLLSALSSLVSSQAPTSLQRDVQTQDLHDPCLPHSTSPPKKHPSSQCSVYTHVFWKSNSPHLATCGSPSPP